MKLTLLQSKGRYLSIGILYMFDCEVEYENLETKVLS